MNTVRRVVQNVKPLHALPSNMYCTATKLTHKNMLPAGTYIVGDPSYQIAANDDYWNEFLDKFWNLDKTDNSKHGVFKFKERWVCVSDTVG